MTDSDLSSDQKAVLASSVHLVEACPGAGKTRAIVARFRARCGDGGRGVALLSFTNAAVDEALKRASDDPSLLTSPNFVGTFDGFLHRYVVTPWHRRTRAKTPTYLDSWDDLPETWTTVRHAHVSGSGLALSSFSPNADGHLEYALEPPIRDGQYVAQLRNASVKLTPLDLAPQASKKTQDLIAAGIFDCDHARVQALSILNDPDIDWLRQRLANRFEEIIIDEFQDCSVIEHELVAGFRALGINVVVVADPDQSIYAFRRATPAAFAEYKAKLRSDELVVLNQNYRSTEAICEVVTSMRSISTERIISAASFEGVATAERVFIAVGSPEYQRKVFISAVEDLGISLSSSIVLSPTRTGAANLSGEPRTDEIGNGNTGKLVRSLATLESSRTVANRKEAVSRASRVLLGSFEWTDELARAGTQARLEALDILASYLNLVVHDLLVRARSWTMPEQVNVSIMETIRTRFVDISIPLVALGHRFQKIKVEDWTFWQASVFNGIPGLPSLHIHAVKGREFDAVMLDIPNKRRPGKAHVLDDWETKVLSEPLRVLYVGASRARRLLVLATTPRHEEQIRRILESNGIDAEFVVESHD